jgi:hypothetical protein
MSRGAHGPRFRVARLADLGSIGLRTRGVEPDYKAVHALDQLWSGGGACDRNDCEPWTDYRERWKPIDEEFRLRHPQHGSSWTAGGGPIHCSRCCPPPPLSPEQIAQISRIVNPPPPAPLPHATVRRCKVDRC